MEEIIEFPEKDNTNLEEMCRNAIKQCKIVKPKQKFCMECKNKIQLGEKHSTIIRFMNNSSEKYLCHKCNFFDNLVFNFLEQYNIFFIENHNLGVDCWQKEYLKQTLKKALNKKPKAWVRKKEFNKSKNKE